MNKFEKSEVQAYALAKGEANALADPQVLIQPIEQQSLAKSIAEAIQMNSSGSNKRSRRSPSGRSSRKRKSKKTKRKKIKRKKKN